MVVLGGGERRGRGIGKMQKSSMRRFGSLLCSPLAEPENKVGEKLELLVRSNEGRGGREGNKEGDSHARSLPFSFLPLARTSAKVTAESKESKNSSKIFAKLPKTKTVSEENQTRRSETFGSFPFLSSPSIMYFSSRFPSHLPFRRSELLYCNRERERRFCQLRRRSLQSGKEARTKGTEGRLPLRDRVVPSRR